jgi:hypothetical protein
MAATGVLVIIDCGNQHTRIRHCERSEAIQLHAGRRTQEMLRFRQCRNLFGALRARWIASLRSQ